MEKYKTAEKNETVNGLRVPEEIYRDYFDNLNDAAFLADIKTGIIVEANKQAVKLLGRSYDEIIGMHQCQLHPPEKAEQFQELFRSHSKNAVSFCEDGEILTKGGDIVPVTISTSVSSVQEKRYILGIFHDISKRKQTEKALKESQEKFSKAFSSNPSCISITTQKDGIFLDINDSFTRELGYTREDVIGHSSKELQLWVKSEERDRILKKLRQSGKVTNEEYSTRTRSGEIKTMLFSAEPISISGELCIIAVTNDITELRRIEQALVESEEKFSAAFRYSPEIIGVSNMETGVYVDVNDSFVSTTGYSREELIGHQVTAINMFVDPRAAEKMAGIMLDKGKFKNQEFAFRMKSGEIRQWLCSSEVTTVRGTPYSISVATDITERKKMEEELREYREYLEELIDIRTNELNDINKKLEQELSERRHVEEELRDAIKRADSANKAKSEFLARMSHEIRTPIHGVMGTLDLLRDTKLDQEQHQYVNMSKTSAETLLNVINDILDFSKIEAGKLDVENKEFELRGVLEETMEAMAVSAHRKGLEIILQLANDVPTALIGDAPHLRQIIINLIGNAVKFTSQGEILLRVEIEAAEKSEVILHFSVKDSGIGIPKEKQGILFRPFEQVDGSNQRKYGGTGLGLSICMQLVTLMGGRIWFKSWLGEGSVFHFTLKFKKQTAPTQVNNLQENTTELRGVPLLLIDDNATYRSILKDLLSEWGVRVTEMNSGRSAIKELEDAAGTSHQYRLILLDKEMPEMNGFIAAKQILQNAAPNISIVMMLPSDHISDDFIKCQELGISHFIIKPVKKSDLIGIILKALGQVKSSENVGPEAVTHITGIDAPQCSILLAEDNPTSQLIAKKILEKAGHNVQIVGTGVEAVRMLNDGKFDIILMDVEMPEMSGIEATRVIRKGEQETKKHVPIVAMTAYAMKEDRQRCLDAGMDTYLSKPVNIDELHKILKEYAPKKKVEPCPVDMETAFKFVGGHQEILEEVIHVFLGEDYPEQLQKLKDGIARQDAEVVKQAAHSIKGAVRSLGGKAAGDTALKLEEMGRNNNLTGADQSLQQLEHQIALFTEYYNKYNWEKAE